MPDEYWSTDLDKVKLKLKVEFTALVYGLVKGDEVATHGDPQAQQAATIFPRIAQILRGH